MWHGTIRQRLVGGVMSLTLPVELPFTHVFGDALRGARCRVHNTDGGAELLPVDRWSAAADSSDHELLDRCRGATVDVGCGPGRMTRALADRGGPVLGIDVVPEAVRLTRARGGQALLRSVFEHPLPGEGRWVTALLADGNIGIGGRPVTLLRRLSTMLAHRGRVVLDLSPRGTGLRQRRLWLQTERMFCRPFDWADVGADAVGWIATSAGYVVTELVERPERSYAVLTRAPQ